MPVIAPAQSSLRVMPTAPAVQPELFIQQPNAAAGMQLFEQAAKLPLLMEQIKIEKVRQKAEKAKLDLAELTAQKQLESYDQLALQQKALADAQIALTQAQAAAATVPPADVQRQKGVQATGVQADLYGNTPEGRASMDRDIALNSTIQDFVLKGGTVKQWTAQGGALPESGIFASRGAVDEVVPAGRVADTLANESVATNAGPASTDFPELQEFTTRIVSASPRAVAVSRYAQDNPGVPIDTFAPAEQAKLLAPYLTAAAPKKRKIDFVKEGDKYETTVTESADGLVVYGIDKPLVQSSAPETKATAAVKTKLAFIDSTMKKIDELDKKLDAYEESGAFGAYDVQMAQWAQNPEKPVVLRAVASWLGNPTTKALATDLAAIGAKTMTELAGSAQTAGEAQRLGPYVPAASDPVQGKDATRAKIQAFKKELAITRDSLEAQFGMKTKQPAAAAPAGPATPTPTAPLDKAISDYLNAP